jgi:alkanesulfonate monooxygenase SsuD/methylene tetrahydromethanopterin reductase-like flavin-dependent oxidoreductase (luciferase family)
MSEQTQAPAPPRDWGMLAAWLESDFQNWDRAVHPFHKGMYEAYSTVADLMRDTPTEEREAALYRFLTRVLTAAGEEDNSK